MALVQDLVPLAIPHAQLSLGSRWCHTGRCPVPPSVCCVRTRDSFQRYVSPRLLSGREINREKLWREFFLDPSQWWDHRPEKLNPKYPDFKHKKTQQSLWLVDDLTPPWVEPELAAIRPGTLQSDIFSWNVRLRRYVKAGDHEKAIELFQQLQREGMIPNKFTFVPVLNACSRLQSLENGRLVHEQVSKRGYESDIYVSNCLVNMYAKCGSIEDAWRVFNKMREHTVVSWNAMIGGYVKRGQGLKALELFREMQQEGVEPSAVTFVGLLNACASIVALEEGRHVHQQIIQGGWESDVYVANCLVKMYVKCGSIEDAWRVFNKMPKHSLVSWNVMIGGYVKSGQGLKSIELFHNMEQEGVDPSAVTFVGVLNACANIVGLEEGRRVHGQIIRNGYELDIYVANCLVDMYAKCGSIEESWSVFNKMKERNVISWSVMIGGYVRCGQGLKAMEIFRKMQEEGVEPDAVAFVGILGACGSVAALEEGRLVHQQILSKECESDVYVATCLVDMYAKCGSIDDAWSVFNKMGEHNVVSWNAIIGGFVKSGQALKAMEHYQRMQQEGVEPDAVTFVGVLNACASLAALEEGRLVHGQIIERGFQSDVYVVNCLVDMYAKCGSIWDAWSVFNRMSEHDVVSWTAMIGGFVKSGEGLKAMELFHNMQKEGVEANAFTFVGVLNACATVGALEEGRQVHQQIIERGYECNVYVANCLVDMYSKCGEGLKAMELYQEMQNGGVVPSTVTFIGVLNACASVAALPEGRRVHEQIIQQGCESDVYIATCLVDMYVKCGAIVEAWNVFNNMLEHDVVSWSAIIGGYVKSGQGLKAMELFQKMQQEGVEPDTVTFGVVLNACASVGALEEGRRVHEQIIRRGCESNAYVATCLVDMYAKCESIQDAWTVFNKVEKQNVVSCSTMIGGFVKSGQSLKALELFGKMQEEGVEPDEVTFLEALNACACVGALEEGRRVHEQIIGRGFEMDVYVASCLVDMYAKCGSIEDAQTVFSKMQDHDVVAWNAMIGAYAMHGHSWKAVELFEQMRNEGVEINEITFTCLLSACGHAGLVEEGLHYFESMTSCHNLRPTMKHYACMVDLLGRAGWLDEAEEMTRRMPVERDAAVWRSLLSACRIHGNVEMAERAAKRCWELDPHNASGFVLLSNMYAAGGKWDLIGAIEERLETKVWKDPVCTWIQVNNVVHSFVANDKEHPQILYICAELDSLLVQMNDARYVPDGT